ncbi:MAG: carbamoyltransferase [Candidatus Omnitrophota bacterium]|nr:carbamoyltransferase [Candidatus Omnitrophota bacterium]
MNILGISCFYHDSAAALVRDGEIIAAAQEERFSRKKHDFNFPVQSIEWCLKQAGISARELDLVCFYEKPFLKFERILETSLAVSPRGISQFIQAMPLWLKQKLWTPDIIRKELGYDGKVLFFEHHESHAASAFYPSPFKEAAFLTMDGVGEHDTASFGIGRGNDIEILYTLKFPHSLGLLYSAFTYYTGFKVNSGEYKLMGLAPYGLPKYTQIILDELIDLKDDGSFKLNMRYFGFCDSLKMINLRFEKLFGAAARRPETRITAIYMDVAASIQKITEEIMLRMSRQAHKVTGLDRLCLAGGVALNCVGNGRILRDGPFREVWVQPAAGDAGGALGAALLAWYKYAGNERVADGINDTQKASLLGPGFSPQDIEDFLIKRGAPYRKMQYSEIPGAVSELLARQKVIGWFQGRMEFGPRALGARSIIGDARSSEMQSKMNLKIKFRESFRPFAPSVLLDTAPEWFELNSSSPYMLLTAPVAVSKRVIQDSVESSLAGFDKLKIKRSLIPAVTHVDYSARVQTVKKDDNPLYYDLILKFYALTGCPVIINTSFNVRGEPLVCSPQQAFACFMRTEMDYLVMENIFLDKREQVVQPKDSAWQKEFELD